MTNVMKNQKGFTLLEIIVVLAVLGALAAMLSPVVFRYIDDANRSRTQADARTLATAIQRMYADTGRWPYYADGSGATAYAAADARFLSSLSTCELAGAVDTLDECDGSLTYAAGVAASWAAADNADGLVRQLITNGAPAYSTTSGRTWKGPYTDAIPSVDAWGNPYLVNIGGAAPANNKAVVVVSAGPNGIIETAADSASTSNLTAGGDDVAARVK